MYEFKFSDIGEGLHEGKILELKRQPGDEVEQGDILAIVETDKVVAEITSSVTGVLHRYGSQAGDIIKVGDTLAYIEVDGDEQVVTDTGEDTGEGARGSKPGDGATVVGQLPSDDDLLPPSDETGPLDDGEGRPPQEEAVLPPLRRAFATPAARRRARALNVNLAIVRGTGDDGRFQKSDIDDIAEAQASAPPAIRQPSSGREPLGSPLIDDPLAGLVDLPPGQRVELTVLRKTIARKMEISGRIPTAVVHDIGEVDELVALRAKANCDTHISYQPFFMKALAIALREAPVLNATYDEVSQEVTSYCEVNIGFAVNTEAGVLLPVIRNVEDSNILAIDRQMKKLVAAVRNRSLAAEDLRGGTFTLTNFGSFGGLWAQPMIFPPQVAILGIGRIHSAPRVAPGGAVEARVALPVSLAFDHRVVDGVPAATFLTRFLKILCSPQELMVSM